MKIVNAQWAREIEIKWASGVKLDEIIAFPKAATWLIAFLAKRNEPFSVHNLGGGVKRITTDTDICPCCKKKL